jgi:hypothetical protein
VCELDGITVDGHENPDRSGSFIRCRQVYYEVRPADQ